MVLIDVKSNHRLSPREITNGAPPHSASSTSPSPSPSNPVGLSLYHHVTSYKAPYNRTPLACLSSLMLWSHTLTPPLTPHHRVLYHQSCNRVCFSVYLAVEISVSPPTIHVNLHIQFQSNRLFAVCLCGQITRKYLNSTWIPKTSSRDTV